MSNVDGHFSWADYVDLARDLVAGDAVSEAAASRAYYGLPGACRWWLISHVGYLASPGPEDHVKVWEQFDRMGTEAALLVATAGETLKLGRKHADYDATREFTHALAVQMVSAARHGLSALEQLAR